MFNRRNIAAPFQHKNEPPPKHPPHAHPKPEVSDGFVNFRNFTFPPVESVHNLKFNKYCGPTPESNWVIPGVLLVGAYPASDDDEDTFELITSILKQGVSKFVCLQSEYQAGVPRHIWLAGSALRPYFEDVREIVAQKDEIRELRSHKIVTPDKLSFDHCPIVDCGVTDDSKVLALAQKLVKDISEGEVIYLHCWGGHGRTGTVVCIMLYLLYGMSHREAFEYCQAVHDLRTCPVEVGSPQTQSQRQQVVRVIEMLMADYEQRKALHDEAAMQRFHAQLQKQADCAGASGASNGAAAVVAATNNSNGESSHQSASASGDTSTGRNTPVKAQSPVKSPVKPHVVVRETTQEHIFQMSKNTVPANQSAANGYSNKNLGRKKPNTGAGVSGNTATSTAAALKTSTTGTTFPAIQKSNSTVPGVVPSTPAAMSSAQVMEGAENTYMDVSPLTIPSHSGGAVNTPAISKAPDTGTALLQTLQAHPPRNPPPQGSRAESLNKLHSRGLSPLRSKESLTSGEVYIPQSSDEGENSTNEEDEEGFIISQLSSHASLLAEQHALAERMQVASPGVAESAYPDTPGIGYISSSTSCASHAMSFTAQDSPFPTGISTHDSTVTSDSMDFSADENSGKESTAVPVMISASLLKASFGVGNPALALGGKSTDGSVSEGENEPMRVAAADDQDTDYDDSVRAASATSAAMAPSSGPSAPSTAAPTESVKPKRLSGAKVISNAFKAGIKIFTGGSSSSGHSTPNKKQPATDKNHAHAGHVGHVGHAHETHKNGSAHSNAHDAAHHGGAKGSVGANVSAGANLAVSLKTASTDSTASANTGRSQSNATTPTNHAGASAPAGTGANS